MKRPILIIIGAVIVLILLGVWVYVLFFSTPNTDTDVFFNPDLSDTTDGSYNPITNDPEPIVDVEGVERLRQLTTTPVVGYQEVQLTASSSPTVYYVAAGTGYIFTINLETGEEKRISGTTIPSSQKAAITPDGQFVMIQSGSGSSADFIIGMLSTTSDSLETGLINEPVVDFVATNENTFLYAIKTTSNVVAKEYNPNTETTTTLFTIPFRDAQIDWGTTADGTHYVYPKGTTKFEGYIYAAQNGTLNRLPIAGYGLSATGNEGGVLFSTQNKGYTTSLYSSEIKTVSEIFLSTIPEKCARFNLDENQIICGTGDGVNNTQMPDSWYMGEETYSDNLWSFNVVDGAFTQLINTEQEVGRTIEINNIIVNQNDEHFYFINSSTKNLWMFNNEL